MNKRRLRPYAAVILVILYALDIFWLSGKITWEIGVWGTVVYEGLLVMIAVAVVVLFRSDLKKVIPFRRPKFHKVAGTFVLWMGTYCAAMIPSSIMLYVFPRQMAQASQGVNDAASSVSFVAAVFLICVTPAVCEEIAFRGALFSCFRGFRSPWVGILVVAAVFGAFHGSIWRFVPTAILGIAMGYLLAETDNMFYNMLFHFVNNMFPVILLQLMGGVNMNNGMQTSAVSQIPLMTVAIYISFGAAAPFLLYAGDYLIHRGKPGYCNGLLPREKNLVFLVLLMVSAGLLILGMILFGLSIRVDSGIVYGM